MRNETTQKKRSPVRFLVPGLLALAGALFAFAMRGYTYLGYACFGLALFTFFWCLLRANGRRYLLILLVLALAVFAFFEAPVLQGLSGTEDAEAGVQSEPVGAIIILGAGLNGNQPTRNLTWRLETAADFAKLHPEAYVICSGGQGADEIVSEASAMAGWLQAHGISQKRILLEEQSTSTMENLTFSYQLWQSVQNSKGEDAPDRIVVVSSEYHMARIESMLEKLKIEHATTLPARTRLPLLRVSMCIREAFGMAQYRILGK